MSFRTSRHIAPAAIGVELLPCPFCGLSAGLVYGGRTPHVTCNACGADGPLPRAGAESTMRDAAQAWNTRAAPPKERTA